MGHLAPFPGLSITAPNVFQIKKITCEAYRQAQKVFGYFY